MKLVVMLFRQMTSVLFVSAAMACENDLSKTSCQSGAQNAVSGGDIIQIQINHRVSDAPLFNVLKSLRSPNLLEDHEAIQRPEEEIIFNLFKSGTHLIAMDGPQGVGKTYVAESIWKTWYSFKGYLAIWVNAKDERSLLASYARWADLSGVSYNSADPADLKDSVIDVLKNTENTLFIFDHVENRTLVEDYTYGLSHAVYILLTTRHRNYFGSKFKIFTLDCFSYSQAEKYISINLPWFQKHEIDHLIEGVGTFPIVLSWSIGYLRNNKLSGLAGLLQKIEMAHVIHQPLDPVFVAVIMNLKKHSLRAWELLKHAVLLDVNFVPVDTLKQALSVESEGLDRKFNVLESLSLAQALRNPSGDWGIRIHKLAQEQAFSYGRIFSEDSPERYRDKLVCLIEKFLPEPSLKTDLEAVKLHFSSAEQLLSASIEQSLCSAHLLRKFAWYTLYVYSKYEKANELYKKAFEILQYYPEGVSYSMKMFENNYRNYLSHPSWDQANKNDQDDEILLACCLLEHFGYSAYQRSLDIFASTLEGHPGELEMIQTLLQVVQEEIRTNMKTKYGLVLAALLLDRDRITRLELLNELRWNDLMRQAEPYIKQAIFSNDWIFSEVTCFFSQMSHLRTLARVSSPYGCRQSCALKFKKSVYDEIQWNFHEEKVSTILKPEEIVFQADEKPKLEVSSDLSFEFRMAPIALIVSIPSLIPLIL
ncbi:MAG: hypothetical protein I8H75_04135 [Myxococcaceae bacterium]|nr:hypothetical protein [Myxococcaceae bacterium]